MCDYSVSYKDKKNIFKCFEYQNATCLDTLQGKYPSRIKDKYLNYIFLLI